METRVMPEEPSLPGWLKFANPVMVALQRCGVVIGTVRLLSVPGRKSGRLHTTPVSPLTVNGKRYVISGLEDADWVKNARIAGWGTLERGRKKERVNLVELPVRERAPILGAFPQEVPYGVRYFRQLYGIDGTPEEFEELAPRCPVFRMEAGP
jgi:hypothetical protein